MKLLAAVALMVIGISLPACSQHGGSHGGFSGHGGSVSHGGGFHASAPGFHAPSSSRPTGFARPSGIRAVPQASYRGGAAHAGTRQPYTGSWRYRRPYVSPYRVGVPYGVVGLGYPGYLSYDSGDDTGSAPAVASEAYDGPPPPDLPPYPNQVAPSMPEPTPAPATQEAVTLVFADGRPSEQIHNYMLTRTTLFVLDQRHQDIPIDQLDLAATAKVNHDAGVDFHLPVAPGQ
ncbi:MAG: hypothetical protein ABR976_16825 [Terracidiphilus sp.]